MQRAHQQLHSLHLILLHLQVAVSLMLVNAAVDCSPWKSCLEAGWWQSHAWHCLWGLMGPPLYQVVMLLLCLRPPLLQQ